MANTSIKGTILVVDDEENALEMAEATLGDDYSVITANSVKAALEKLEQFKFDAALVDYHMPGDNGVALVDHLMTLMPYERIFLVTADRDQEKVGKVINFIEKPYHPNDLLRALDYALRSKDG
jgi:response regulator RpfG family c-di-GMP phosphodiesterase